MIQMEGTLLNRGRPHGLSWHGRRKKWWALAVIFAIAITVSYAVIRRSQPAQAGISVSGNKFYVDGQPFIPHGFNSIALLHSQWCATIPSTRAAERFGATEFSAAKYKWHANTLRFQVSQPVLSGANGAVYARQIGTDVEQARQAGFVIDVSMQDRSPACGSAQPLPSDTTNGTSNTNTLLAWKTLITNTSLKADPYVMFELYNEPNNLPISAPPSSPRVWTWEDWLTGGRPIEPRPGDAWSGYTPIGMQTLVNYLRTKLAVTNVLIADGAKLAETLARVPMIHDPGRKDQIAYAIHPYIYSDPPSHWMTRWGYLAAVRPVIATEWDCDENHSLAEPAETAALLRYMRSIGVGVLGHTLDEYPGSLMSNASLDPNACGRLFQRYYTDYFAPG